MPRPMLVGSHAGWLIPIACVAWATSTSAMTMVTPLTIAMCRNSSGPWALAAGPNTPVTTSCAAGNIPASMPMSGNGPSLADLSDAFAEGYLRSALQRRLQPGRQRWGVPT